MSSVQENMEIWSQVCTTDPETTQKVNFGAFKFTTVDAQTQIKQATQLFGPCGKGWGIKNSHFEPLICDPADPHFTLLTYTAQFWYKVDGVEYEFDMAADIELFENTKNGWKRQTDPLKKVRTDALTKALSWLGFASDIFEGKFDDNKYMAKLNAAKEQGKLPKIQGIKSRGTDHPSKPSLPVSSTPAPAPQAPATPSAAPTQAEVTLEAPIDVTAPEGASINPSSPAQPQETAAIAPKADSNTPMALATTAAPENPKEKVRTEIFKTKLSKDMKEALEKCQAAWTAIQTMIERMVKPEDGPIVQEQLANLTSQMLGLEFIPTVPQGDITMEKLQNVYPHLASFHQALSIMRFLRGIQKAEEAMAIVQEHAGLEFIGKFTPQTLSEVTRMIVARDAQAKIAELKAALVEAVKSGG